MAYRASAFCPGHITAFFEVCPHADPMQMGSRGAGLCVTLGAKASVVAQAAGQQKVRIFLEGKEGEAPTTQAAAEDLLGDGKWDVRVFLESTLPVSQGFGLSGASALAAALAVNEALSLGHARDRVVAAAHRAEVTNRTGLGDTVPQSLGGMDLRRKPGAPPFADVQRFDVESDLLLAVVGSEIPTEGVLGDAARVRAINASGATCVEEFSQRPSLESLFVLGRRFALDTGLATGRLREAMEACRAYGRASQSMLGNSLFAAGDLDMLEAVVKPLGPWFRCAIDREGARLV